MAELTIHGLPVSPEDSQLLQDYLRLTDETPTEAIIFNALDRDANGSLTQDDLILMGPSLVTSAIRSIAARYGLVFKDTTFPEKMPRPERNPKSVIVRLLEQSDFLFVGECHTVFDEKYFVPLLARLKRHGLSQIALEVSIDDQEAITRYLKTGDTETLKKPTADISSDYMPFIREAYRLNLDVVCIDKTRSMDSTNMPDGYRDANMTKNLIDHRRPGKTLVVVGGSHAVKDNVPFATARQGLEDAGFTTSAIHLESANSMAWVDAWCFEAFLTYYQRSSPHRTLLFDAHAFQGGLFYDTFSAPDNFLVRYDQAFDAVMFLSEKDSPNRIF